MASVRWLGHAAFEVEISGKVVLIDPFLRDNPLAAISPDDIRRADVIVVTHDHPDHFGDSVEIARRLGSRFVSVYETALKASEAGLGDKAVGMNIGGTFNLEGLSVTLTPALHSMSSNPCGVVVSDGRVSIYHAGDTSLFGDMKLIGQLHKPRVALLPIGGFYTMGPKEAAIAARLIKPKIAVPMHYGTFPEICAEPDEFRKEVRRRARGVKVKILKPGEAFRV